MRGVTHDLRDPLGAADGAAALMEAGVRGPPLTDSQRDMVARIRRGITAAFAIISDLLELSRAEEGQLDIDVSSTDVSQVLAQVADDHRLQAGASRIVVACEIPVGLPAVASDGRRVLGIISNLVSNAVKYTPPGGRVTLGAAVRTDGGAPGAGRWMALTVADTGPGIPLGDRGKIFKEFERADATADTPGVGLGLAISRSISRLLGGEITVEVPQAGGSVFTLWLPLDEARIPRRAAS
jgi:signal transduction histidine kinase